MEKSFRIKSIDLLRIICILVVFLCHGWLMLGGTVKTIVDDGTGRALELFFIFSGGFVTVRNLDRDLKTKDFFLHELKKVYPQYLIAHLIVFVYETVLFFQVHLRR